MSRPIQDGGKAGRRVHAHELTRASEDETEATRRESRQRSERLERDRARFGPLRADAQNWRRSA